MPMQWNAEADAKLFAGFIQVHDVKPINLQALATFMGNDCTPKAISHRLALIKKKGASAGSGTATSSTPGKRSRSNAVSVPKNLKPTSVPSASHNNANGKHNRDEQTEEEAETSEDAETAHDEEIKHPAKKLKIEEEV